jgi:hypothetical protein
MARAGHHADVLYDHEPSFDSAPSSPSPKVFGSNVTMDTFEGSHEAVRIFNAERDAADIIEQIFDGAWSVTGELSEPPWWLGTVWGSPVSTEITSPTYEHDYSLDSGGDPRSIRIYAPTEGFSNYEYLPGCVASTLTIDQSVPGNPEFTLSGAYAREPQDDNTVDLTVPDLSERTFNNRKASLTVGGDTVGIVQNATLTVETNTDLINELGTGHAVDFSPKVFAPSIDYEKIVATDQTVDLLSRFKGRTQVGVDFQYDNGEPSGEQYEVQFALSQVFPSDWSETGRNDPEADLMEDLSEMAQSATAKIINDDSTEQ